MSAFEHQIGYMAEFISKYGYSSFAFGFMDDEAKRVVDLNWLVTIQKIEKFPVHEVVGYLELGD
jgi:hypothetical protein